MTTLGHDADQSWSKNFNLKGEKRMLNMLGLLLKVFKRLLMCSLNENILFAYFISVE